MVYEEHESDTTNRGYPDFATRLEIRVRGLGIADGEP